MRALAVLVSGVILAGCTVVGIRSGTEEPHFDVVARVGDVEIRQYGPRIAAEATVAGEEYAARNAGFRKVAAYIFGENHTQAKVAMTAPVAQSVAEASEKIAMTVPVSQENRDGRWTIRFFMPSQYTMATLPVPTDPDVKLVEVPGETKAVLRFSGFAGPEAVAEERALLLKGLSGSGWTAQGTPDVWFYDPPWALPFVRRNEVVVGVRAKGT